MHIFLKVSQKQNYTENKRRELFADVANVKSPPSQLKNDRRPYQIVCEKSIIYHYLTEGSEENFRALFVTNQFQKLVLHYQRETEFLLYL